MSVRHRRVASPSCSIEVLLSRLDGAAEERVVHRGRLPHGHHLGWVVRWMDEGTFVVRLFGDTEVRYRLDEDGTVRLLTDVGAVGLFEEPSPVPTASRDWLDYFEVNGRNLIDIPWGDGATSTEMEIKKITASIQGFQLGESSEGHHLMASARAYAELTGDSYYAEAVKRFIREEQRHARDLGRFMDLAGIPRIERTWPDTIFRKLRQYAGLELSISVLITAEIIAKVYYPALREATGSPVLQTLCDQIIQDEIRHVEFQAERLAILRRHRRPLGLAVTHGLHRFLFWGTLWVVWMKHAKGFRAGGFGFLKFWDEAWRQFRQTSRMMDPRTYR